MGSIPTRFRHLRGETPFLCGVFAFIADWLKLSKNGNLCHYIATLNLKLARIAIKNVKMNQLKENECSKKEKEFSRLYFRTFNDSIADYKKKVS